MTNMKRLAALFLGVGFLAAGCGPQWAVVKQANPNPFAAQRAFVVEPMKFDGMQVGKLSEADYLAKKNADQQASFQADKSAMNEKFGERLTELAAKKSVALTPAAGAPAGYTIRAVVSFLEPGVYIPRVGGLGVDLSRPTVVRANLQIVDAQGAVLDDISINAEVAADLINAASGTRYRKAAEKLAEKANLYLIERLGLAKK